jgi:hypothetical protein
VSRRHKPACTSRNILPGLNPRPLFPHPFVFSSLLGPQITANSNYSRTSTKCARKSNHSRTSAKTGGWGCYRYGDVSKICRRADILECGLFTLLAPIFEGSLEGPPLLRVTRGRQLNCMGGTDGIAKAGALRGAQGKQAPALQGRLSPAPGEDNEEEEEERSLDYATRRATMRRGRESRVAPLGMTNHESRVRGHASRLTPPSNGGQAGGRALHKKEEPKSGPRQKASATRRRGR